MIIFVNLIGKLVQAEKYLVGIKYIDYLGELDVNISTGWETTWMILTVSIISMNLIAKFGQAENDL